MPTTDILHRELVDLDMLIRRSELVGYATQALKMDPNWATVPDANRRETASRLMFTRHRLSDVIRERREVFS